MSCFLGFRHRLRTKILLTGLFVACPILVTLGFTIFELQRENEKVSRITQQNTTNNRAAFEALNAAQLGRLALYKALAEQQPSVETFNHLLQEFEGTVTTFDIFIKAIMWGSTSDEFISSDGGLTYAQWVRRGWDKQLTIEPITPDVKTFADHANKAHINFTNHARELIYALRESEYRRLDADFSGVEEMRAVARAQLDQVEEYEDEVAQAMIDLQSAVHQVVGELLNKIATSQQETIHSLILTSCFLLIIGLPFLFFLQKT